MPSLEEYISICKKYDKVAVLKLKNEFSRDEIFEICDIIENTDYMHCVIFISFCLNNLFYLKEKYPNQKAQYLVSDISDFLIGILKDNKLDLDIYHQALTEEFAKKCIDSEIKINCWTVNTEDVASKLMSYGAKYLTTNILE